MRMRMRNQYILRAFAIEILRAEVKIENYSCCKYITSFNKKPI